ncbi:hypothetical protein [Bacillus phage SDFMU_Pfc]|nr:hypothetical protein [Bacillus phage SDFMU_Pfc]
MSFVSLFLTKDFIIVTSDGQITDTETLEVDQDNFQKFVQLTSYQYFAFTGNLNLANIVFNRCKKKIRNNNGYCDLKELSIFIKRILEQYIDEAYCCIVLCGFDKNNNPEYYYIHTLYSCIDSQILFNDGWLFRVLTSDHLEVGVHEITSNLESYFEKEEADFKNPEIVIAKLNGINSLVSQHDISVNDMFYYHVINRKYSYKEIILNLINKFRAKLGKLHSQ